MVDVMMNLVCDNVVLSVTADVKSNHVLVDETFRNINTDGTTMWKVTTKEQDPTQLYFSIKGVVWVVLDIDPCPFLPYWEDHGNSMSYVSTCLPPTKSRTILYLSLQYVVAFRRCVTTDYTTVACIHVQSHLHKYTSYRCKLHK